jgi:hypothetical protein
LGFRANGVEIVSRRRRGKMLLERLHRRWMEGEGSTGLP